MIDPLSLPAPQFSGTERFEIISCLGEGAMGVVYEAKDLESDTRVALKVLRVPSAAGIARFKREFRALQDVQHRNLISRGELVRAGEHWFFTMELVVGVHFLEHVRPRDSARSVGVLDLTRLRAALPQIVRGLCALHKAGKVHRDIKPSNLIVTDAGRLVIVDFGLVADSSSALALAERDGVGTAAYMAPEQVSAQRLTSAADWYGLGVVLFEALTGQLPFSGHASEVMRAKQHKASPSPRDVVSDIPEDLDLLCSALLATNPNDRPTDTILRQRFDVRGIAGGVHRGLRKLPFVGRASQLHALREFYWQARKGDSVMVCVDGPSGVGKTALVEQFLNEVREQEPGVLVFSGRCYERESVPYKAMDGVVDEVSRYLIELGPAAKNCLPRKVELLVQAFPALRRVEAVAKAPLVDHYVRSPRELRRRVFAEFRQLLLTMARQHTIILAIDDLQWADADSLALLGEATRSPGAARVLVLGTVLQKDKGDAATRIADYLRGKIFRVSVGRLSLDESTDLVRQLVLAADVSPLADPRALAKEAEGHPLFIDELVRHAIAHPERSYLDLRLDGVLRSRVDGLDDASREVLNLIAVAGLPVRQKIVAHAFGDPSSFYKRVSTLRLARMVKTAGARADDVVEIYHLRIAETVTASLSHQQKSDHHFRLAIAHEGSGRPAYEILARHWEGAGDTAKAAHYATLAGKQADDALAFDRAARHYAKALELRPDHPGLAENTLALAYALECSGRSADAARVYFRGAELLPESESLRIRCLAADLQLRAGHIDDGMASTQRVLAQVDIPFPKTPRATLFALVVQRLRLRLRGYGHRPATAQQISPRLLQRMDACRAAAMGTSIADPMLASFFQTINLRMALDAGEPARLARALAGEVVLRTAAFGGSPALDRLSARAQKLAHDSGSSETVGKVMTLSGMAALTAGDWRLAHERCSEAETMLRASSVGTPWELTNAQLVGFLALINMGEFAQARDRRQVLLREAVDSGDLYSMTSLRSGFAHFLWLVSDDPEAARRESAEAMRKWSHDRYLLQHAFDLISHVQTDIYTGDSESAYRRTATDWPVLKASHHMRVRLVRVWIHGLRARAVLAVMRDQPAERRHLVSVARKDAKAIRRHKSTWTDALASGIHAGIFACEDNVEAAVAALDSAEVGFAASHMSHYALAAKRRRGELVGGSEGSALIELADETMAAQGVKRPDKFTDMLLPGF